MLLEWVNNYPVSDDSKTTVSLFTEEAFAALTETAEVFCATSRTLVVKSSATPEIFIRVSGQAYVLFGTLNDGVKHIPKVQVVKRGKVSTSDTFLQKIQKLTKSFKSGILPRS